MFPISFRRTLVGLKVSRHTEYVLVRVNKSTVDGQTVARLQPVDFSALSPLCLR
jgi:hypothetical protein